MARLTTAPPPRAASVVRTRSVRVTRDPATGRTVRDHRARRTAAPPPKTGSTLRAGVPRANETFTSEGRAYRLSVAKERRAALEITKRDHRVPVIDAPDPEPAGRPWPPASATPAPTPAPTPPVTSSKGSGGGAAYEYPTNKAAVIPDLDPILFYDSDVVEEETGSVPMVAIVGAAALVAWLVFK